MSPGWAGVALAGSLTGRVVGSTGEPVGGATVHVAMVSGPDAEHSTDAAGQFEVGELEPGDYRVRIEPRQDAPWATLFVGGESRRCDADPVTLADEPVDLGTIVLPLGGEVTGVILDAMGEPVPYIEIFTGVSLLDVLPERHLPRTAFTDVDGAFRLVGVPLNVADLQLLAIGGSIPEQVLPVDLGVGLHEPGDLVELGGMQVLPGVWVRGTVSGPSGPVAAGTVHASATSQVRSVEIATDGTYEVMGLPPGDILVWAESPGLATTYFPDSEGPGDRVPLLGEAESADGIDLLLPAEARVTGQLLGADDFTGASVAFIKDARGFVTSVEADGTFELGGLHRGDYTLLVSASEQGLQPGALLSEGGEPVFTLESGPNDVGELLLSEGATVSGRVVDAQTEVPVLGALVYAESTRGGTVEIAVTDSDGAYRIGGLHPGVWTLRVSVQAMCPSDPGWVTVYHLDGINPALRRALQVDPGDMHVWDVSLPPDGDHDGMDDRWEDGTGLDPEIDDGSLDPDHDGYSNLEEYFLGTDPMAAGGSSGCGCTTGGPGLARFAPAAGLAVVLGGLMARRRWSVARRLSLAVAMAVGVAAVLGPTSAHAGTEVRGMTISCPTWGWEWGTDDMVRTLDVLKADGVNWISIHPYARISGDGGVRFKPTDASDPPAWLARPIAEAHARGMRVMIKPHLAYWGSPFGWRGEIAFDDADERARFFSEYAAWITDLASSSTGADAFVVGTELDLTVQHEAEWRSVIAQVRAVHPGPITYAANWDRFEAVPFWDAVDSIGVQAYFPVVTEGGTPEGQVPDADELRRGWDRVLKQVRAVHERTGKHVVFTEIGYDDTATAHLRPWKSGGGPNGTAIQGALMRSALQAIDREPSVVGAFWWKWFPGEKQHGDFRMSTPEARAVLREAWAQ